MAIKDDAQAEEIEKGILERRRLIQLEREKKENENNEKDLTKKKNLLKINNFLKKITII